MKQKVRIILPTYNERNNINILIPKIFKIFKENKINGDILIVDDNSPDGTANLAKKLSKKYPIKILEREKKLGIGSAYVLGFKKSLEDKKDIIFEMDSDLSHDPKYIPEFIEKINSGFDVVIGERKKVVGWNWYRKLISWGGNFIGRNIAGVKIKDLTTGYRAYKRHVLDSINLDKIKGKVNEKKFIGAKVGDVLKLKTKGLFKDDHDLMHALGVNHDEAHDLNVELQFTIEEITETQLAELNQELFDKVFGADKVKNIEEAKLIVKHLKPNKNLGDIKSRRIFEDASRSYQQALAGAQQAQEAQQRRQLSAGQQLSGLTGQLGNLAKTQAGIGGLGQQMLGTDISTLLGVGGQQQQLLQAGFEAQRQNIAAQQQEPFQRISFGTEVLGGLPFGGQTISQIPVTPANPFLQFAGGIGSLGTGIGTLLEGIGSFQRS